MYNRKNDVGIWVFIGGLIGTFIAFVVRNTYKLANKITGVVVDKVKK